MPKRPQGEKPELLRRSILVGGAAAALMPRAAVAQAAGTIRIGVPTKTYWPTIICETAIRQKLFEKEGIKAELTIYRSGAEGFEAIAAGAADLVLNSSSSVAGGLRKGVNVKCVANGANGYYGWYLVVKSDSPIKKVSELAGKKVGITSAGSGTDILARWTIAKEKIDFTRVPLGGGGLVPNLLTGNIDASVLYSPLTYKVIDEKVARPLTDYGAEVPPHSNSAWIASDKIIKERPEVLQKAINAIYGGVGFLVADANRTAAVKLIAEIDEIPEPIAARELDGNIKHLSRDGEMRLEWMERAGAPHRHDGSGAGQGHLHHAVQAGSDQGVASLRTATMTRLQIRLTRLALLALVLAAWEILPRSGIVNPLLLPPLSQVLLTLVDLLGRPTVHEAVAVTAGEVIVAFIIAVPLGAAAGIVIAENEYLGEIFKPMLFYVFSIPKSIFLPMFILVLGIGFQQKVAYAAFTTAFVVLMSATAAVESVRSDHVMVARSYGATQMQILLRVYVPSMMPILLETLRISMIFNFTGVMIAEMYASRTGIGHMISNWGENFQMPQLFAGVIVLAAVAILFNEAVRALEARCSTWRT